MEAFKSLLNGMQMSINKLIFCGNSSIDHILTHKGAKETIGGSAVNAAISGSLFGNKEIALISSVGYDFPIDTLDKLNISTEHMQQYEENTNSFIIDEINNTVSLKSKQYLPIIIPDNTETNHLHVSCRKGVPFVDAFNKIKSQHYSLDVMWSSVKDFLPELSACIQKADFLFCNDTEFMMMKREGLIDTVPENLIIFTTDKHGVIYQKGKKQKYFHTIKKEDVVSTIGAGDTFLGSFLSSFNGNNLNEAVYQSLAMASLSTEDFGNMHLLNKFSEINKTKNIIRNMDKNNETTFNIYNRPVLQR